MGLDKVAITFFSRETLTNKVKRNLICMIPKSEEPTILKNFKRITLINMVNKIFSKVIANRVATFVHEIISPEQGAL